LKKIENFWLISGLCWFVYVCAYFGRVNLSISLPYLCEAYGYSKASLGLVASGFFTAYAAGQFINGILGDRFNPRYFVGFGLFCAGITNILFGSSRNLWSMFCFWTLNGYFQSTLWGPLVRIIALVSPPPQLPKMAMIISSSTILGYLFSYTLVGRMVVSMGWQTSFYIPGFILIFAAAFWVWALRHYTVKERPVSAEIETNPPASIGTFDFIIRGKLWVVALICIFQGSVKEGLTLWAPAFFSEFPTLPMNKVMMIMSFIPLMSLIALIMGSMVNKRFKYQEKFTIIVFSILALISVVILRISMSSGFIIMIIAVLLLSASTFTVNNMLTAVVPLNFQKERRISAAAGFFDSAVYIGAAVSGPLTGFLADHSGWSGVINGWITVCAISIITALFSRNYRIKTLSRSIKGFPAVRNRDSHKPR
jgi:OPA family glycerol-3-phosphate transporter-like MFS transporter